MKCVSGRHEWTGPADARKCCNGWHQVLHIYPPLPSAEDYRNGARRVRSMDEEGVAAWWVWVPDERKPVAS